MVSEVAVGDGVRPVNDAVRWSFEVRPDRIRTGSSEEYPTLSHRTPVHGVASRDHRLAGCGEFL